MIQKKLFLAIIFSFLIANMEAQDSLEVQLIFQKALVQGYGKTLAFSLDSAENNWLSGDYKKIYLHQEDGIIPFDAPGFAVGNIRFISQKKTILAGCTKIKSNRPENIKTLKVEASTLKGIPKEFFPSPREFQFQNLHWLADGSNLLAHIQYRAPRRMAGPSDYEGPKGQILLLKPNGKLAQVLLADTEGESNIVFDSQSEWVAFGALNIHLYQKDDWKASTILTNERNRVRITQLGLHENRNLLFASRANGEIEVWNPQTAQFLGFWQAHPQKIHAFALHPSQPILVSCSADNLVKIWFISEDGEARLISEKKMEGLIEGLAFSTNGQTLFISIKQGQGIIHIFDFVYQ